MADSGIWIQRLWAKTDQETGALHLLIYHLIDVAEVTQAMWDQVLDSGKHAALSTGLGLSEVDAGRFLSFLLGLHDLGKASPEFQRKYEAAVPGIREAGLSFPFGSTDIPHGITSTVALAYRGQGLLIDSGVVAHKPAAMALARAIGGHHGVWPDTTQMKNAYDSWREDWIETRRALFEAMRTLYDPPALPEAASLDRETANSFLILLSGFTTVADWIGSMSEYFPFEHNWLPLDQYRQRAGQQAEHALRETGWARQVRTMTPSLAFADLLPTGAAPNPLQQAVIEASAGAGEQSLILLEAPTGIGKTELAFYLSSQLMGAQALRGFYVAMPTQATSNQMHGRSESFLKALYPDQQMRPRLLHSQALLHLDTRQIPTGVYDEGAGRISTWFLPKKRGLLEPFAVGTVDQALLSVLWTRHFFVRLFGLDRKVLIFDEVHAYDSYMNELFLTLLAWLRWLGSSVLILSATLPNETRRQLVEAFGGRGEALEETSGSNARLTLVNVGGEVLACELDTATESREVRLGWLVPEQLADTLNEALVDGGCAAVICNTVAKAQEVYQHLQQAGIEDCELMLFHARYPAAWRQGIEAEALRRFGKEGQRPHRAISVATQVIEQSLDLDFDLLITELAPIDLLIQRIGRLHRHARNTRPAALESPRTLILQPGAEGDDLDFGNSAYVYDPFLLRATWSVLQLLDHLSLPAQTRALIEAVYGEGWRDLPEADSLAGLRRAYLGGQGQDQYQAALKHIPAPGAASVLDGHNNALDEDDPTLHPVFQAMTRLIEHTVQVICLHRTGEGWSLEPDGSEPVDEHSAPDLKRLLRYVVSVSTAPVFRAITTESAYDLPKAWAKDGALKHHRLLRFDESGECRIAGTRFTLRLTREYGLKVNKE